MIAAESLAREMFNTIGVRIVWSRSRAGAAAFVRVVDWRAGHPADQLAYVEPYAPAPRPVVILFRNLKGVAGKEPLLTNLLGHVLCHELAHLLAGVDAHSPEGVMKARWSVRDLQAMTHAPLRFLSYDAARVHLGMERLSLRTTPAGETPGATEH